MSLGTCPVCCGVPDDRCPEHRTIVVTSVDDLVRKYGTRTIGLAVGRLMAVLGSDLGVDTALARELGVMMADLQSALEDHVRRSR